MGEEEVWVAADYDGHLLGVANSQVAAVALCEDWLTKCTRDAVIVEPWFITGDRLVRYYESRGKVESQTVWPQPLLTVEGATWPPPRAAARPADPDRDGEA